MRTFLCTLCKTEAKPDDESCAFCGGSTIRPTKRGEIAYPAEG